MIAGPVGRHRGAAEQSDASAVACARLATVLGTLGAEFPPDLVALMVELRALLPDVVGVRLEVDGDPPVVLTCGDTTAAPARADTTGPARGDGWVTVPLRRRAQVLGALAVTGAAASDLPDDVLAVVGHHVAVATEELAAERAAAHLERAVRAERQLFEDSATATTVEAAGEVLARVTAEAFATERAAVHLTGPDGRIAHVLGVGIPDEVVTALERSLVGRLAQDSPVWRAIEELGGPVLVDRADAAAVRPGGFVQTLGLRSYLAMPLLSAEGVLGMVMCGDVARHRVWTDRDRRLARQLALTGGVVVDAARLRHAERAHVQELTRLAFHDSLTGLANRSLLFRRFDEVAGDHRPVALLLLDLDGFKAVNDELGHAAGDRLLQHAAQRMRSVVGDAGTVARIGGDEFAVLLDGRAGAVDAAAVGDALHRRLREPFELGGRRVGIGVSVGVARRGPDGTGIGDLLHCADAGMYMAKRRSRTRGPRPAA